jgi:hypothetical protein
MRPGGPLSPHASAAMGQRWAEANRGFRHKAPVADNVAAQHDCAHFVTVRPPPPMPVTSSRRIHVAQQFVRFGFGEHVDEGAAFFSAEFLTQELTTTEVQAVLSVVQTFNAFSGGRVGGGIERFRGRVTGWKFGRMGGPLLVVSLPYWTHQVEENPAGGKVGSPVHDSAHQALVEELRALFLNELDARGFGPRDDSDHVFGAWWG